MIETSCKEVLFVNSGGFKLCDIDLSKSLHLYGGNNAGKTTIVNALQFAFVDNFKQMVWDGHKEDETKKHYFDSYSYIVLRFQHQRAAVSRSLRTRAREFFSAFNVGGTMGHWKKALM